MTREEFEEKVKEVGGSTKGLSKSDYDIIEYIYIFHPSVSETEGKKQVAILFSTLGMIPFYDMLYRAQEAEKLENEIRNARQELEKAKEKYEMLKEGKSPLFSCY